MFDFECRLEDSLTLIEGRGEVVWVRTKTSTSGPHGMGIRFLELSENSRRYIQRLMDRHLQQKRHRQLVDKYRLLSKQGSQTCAEEEQHSPPEPNDALSTRQFPSAILTDEATKKDPALEAIIRPADGADLRKRLDESLRQQAELEAQLEAARLEITQLEPEPEAAKTELAELAKKEGALRETAKAVELDLDRAEVKCKALEDERQELVQKLEQSKIECVEVALQFEGAKARQEEIEAARGDLDGRLETAVAEAAAAHEREAEAAAARQELQTDLDRARAQESKREESELCAVAALAECEDSLTESEKIRDELTRDLEAALSTRPRRAPRRSVLGPAALVVGGTGLGALLTLGLGFLEKDAIRIEAPVVPVQSAELVPIENVAASAERTDPSGLLELLEEDRSAAPEQYGRKSAR